MRFTIEDHAVWRATRESPRADVPFVPPLERRRLSEVERAALSVAWRVKVDSEIPVVFSSRWGEIGVTIRLMRQFHSDGEMSPAGFSASVHNAAPGAFSILTRNHAPYTAIAARERSLESGLLEALAWRRQVIFAYAEENTPEFYLPAFGAPQVGCAIAVRLSPSEDGEIAADFRNVDAPPLGFGDFVDFLDGRMSECVTSNVKLSRVTE